MAKDRKKFFLSVIAVIQKLLTIVQNVFIVKIYLLYDRVLDHLICNISLGGVTASKYSNCGAYATQSTNYILLKRIYKELNKLNVNTIVDVGCGKGRFINYLLFKGVKTKIIGVEIDPDVARFCKEHLFRYSNVEIINDNILNIKIFDNAIYYLFNPFKKDVLQKFIKNIESDEKIEEVTIFYVHPIHGNVFDSRAGWNRVRHITVYHISNFYKKPWLIDVWSYRKFRQLN